MAIARCDHLIVVDMGARVVDLLGDETLDVMLELRLTQHPGVSGIGHDGADKEILTLWEQDGVGVKVFRDGYASITPILSLPSGKRLLGNR